MEWHIDVAKARTGDAAAKERAREYLTPFAHGVLLAHTTPANANILVPRVLDEALQNISLEPKQIGSLVAAMARTLGKQSKGETDGSPAATVLRTWNLPEEQREKLVLRLVEGIAGAEIAQVLNASETEVRTALRLGVAAVSNAPMSDDSYLWDMSGAASAYVVQMETVLPTLRYEPQEIHAEPSTSSGQAPTGARPTSQKFSSDEPTNSDATAIPAPPTRPIPSTPAAPRASSPSMQAVSKSKLNFVPLQSPFEQSVYTIPAADLPAAAQTQPVQHQPGPTVVKQSAVPTKEAIALKFDNDRTGAQMPPALARPREAGDDEPETAVNRPRPSAQTESSQRPSASSRSNPNLKAQRASALSLESPQEQSMERGDVFATAVAVPVVVHSEFKQLFKGATPFFLAGIFILGAMGMTWAGLTATERQSKSSWTLVPVLVATQDLSEGTVLVPEFVAQRAVPASQNTDEGGAEKGGMAGSNSVKPDQISFILNQRLAVPVQQGDPLFFSQFVSVRTKEHLSIKILSKMRAINIPVGITQSVANFVKPGDQVDLVANYKEGAEEHAPMVASTVVQNVTVLATGKMSGTTPESALTENEKRFGNVTLLLLPEEAEAVTLGASLGRINLSLRNSEDAERFEAFDGKKTNAKALISGEKQKILEKKRVNTIKIIRGGTPPDVK
jgi:pilus assembly protein CpaB